MDQVLSDRLRSNHGWDAITSALENGLIVVRSDGEIAWIDEKTRRRMNGGLHELKLPIQPARDDTPECFVAVATVTSNGVPLAVCVLQETSSQSGFTRDLIAAIESVMSDTSWLARAIVDKLKALRQTSRPDGRASDLDMLTDREREVLGLICEGRSDSEMSQILKLSPNTIRNHIASLFRKIGVNRRSAAIIWARERAITTHDALVSKRRARGRSSGKPARY